MQTLFEGTSEYYDQYRPKYPAVMFSDIANKFHLISNDRDLDIGCGPGVLTIPLSKYVKEVVAVDVDPGMLKVGEELSKQAGINNIQWLLKSAEDMESLFTKQSNYLIKIFKSVFLPFFLLYI